MATKRSKKTVSPAPAIVENAPAIVENENTIEVKEEKAMTMENAINEVNEVNENERNIIIDTDIENVEKEILNTPAENNQAEEQTEENAPAEDVPGEEKKVIKIDLKKYPLPKEEEQTPTEEQTEENAPAPAETEQTPEEEEQTEDQAEEQTEESDKARKEREKVANMQDELYPFNRIPENIEDLPIEEKRRALIDVVEKNNPLYFIWQGLIWNMSKRAPRSYMRSVEYLRIYSPNLKAIEKENALAKSMLLATYSALPSEVLEKVNAIDRDSLNYFEQIMLDRVLDFTNKNLAEYLIVSSSDIKIVPYLVSASVPAFVLIDVDGATRKQLKENGYKYIDDYETEERNVPGVGSVKSIFGMIYEKQ